MSELKVEVKAAEVGLDSERLKRIDAHFAAYVADGRLPGWLLTVRRHGRLAHVARCGSRDLEAGLPVTDDTLWRIYSMTKPITSVAAMMLYEEGTLALTDPVSAFIPSFADVRVYAGGSDVRPVTVPATEPVRVWHLLTHTAGLTYGFHRVHPVDALYRAGGFEWGAPRGTDLARACDLWAGFPLLFQPGTEWNYSVATDVLGRVVEVASGQRLDEFFTDRIFRPLGMTDTAFWADPAAQPRLAALYSPGPDGKAARLGRPRRGRAPAAASAQRGRRPGVHRGRLRPVHPDAAGPARQPGGRTRRRPAAEPAHGRLHGRNHLPGAVDLETFGRAAVRRDPLPRGRLRPRLCRRARPGAGQGDRLRGRVLLGRRRQHRVLGRPGKRSLTVSFFTQLLPSSTYPIRPQLRQLVYQALTD